MKKSNSDSISFRLLASIFAGLFLLVFGGFYFFKTSAQTESFEKTAVENLVNGRLAFSRRFSGPTAPEGVIMTSNPDGTGQLQLAFSTTLSAIEPAWSPDGTNIIAVDTQQNIDIHVASGTGGSAVTNLTNTAQPIREGNPSWSVTGKIAYERDGQIWTMNADGSGQAQFSAITQPSPSDPAWSPDGTKLAFNSGSKIWVINADGTNQQQVTFSATSDRDPAWSPDGTKIVFTKSNGIAVINADGTNEMLIAPSGGTPSWSPDGTKIAYSIGSASSGGIFTMNPDGTNQVRIVANSTQFPNCCDTLYENPAWQPVAQTPNTFNITGRVSYNNLSVTGATVNLSGTVNASATTDSAGNYQFSNLPAGGNYSVSPSFLRHYFTPANRSFNNLSSNQSGNFDVRGVCLGGKCVKNGRLAFRFNGEIYTMNPDGTSFTNITNNAATDSEPNYSPFGTNIIFTTNRDGNNEIYRMDKEGINLVNLTNNSASDTSAFYSQDGTWIVFVSNRDGNTEIYRMNADGSNQVRLTNDAASDTNAAISPDGQKIIFISTRDGGRQKAFSMNADGTNQQLLPDNTTFSTSYFRPSFSLDGSKVIFGFSPDSGTTHPSVTTMNPDGTNRTTLFFGRYAAYSPDTTKIAYVCCYFDPSFNPPRLRVINSNGSGLEQTFSSTISPSGPEFPNWQGFRVPRAPFDFDGDGLSDISVFRPADGAWYLLRSQAGFAFLQWGISSDTLVPADYDGDLITDIAVWRPSEGNFYILNSFNSTLRLENLGLQGDIPTGGDWDGDGKADPAVYREGSQSTFYYRGSMGNPQGNITFVPWGAAGDKPVVGDYDGDGRTDPAIYRNGIWWIKQSSDGQGLAYSFGLPNDKLVPADYDGDGKTDLAVFRDGIWYQLRSAQGFTAFQFGIANDTPTPADYDGDGKADPAVFRDGVWWLLKSQSGTAQAVPFGINTDKPIPSAFVR